jgi:DNA-binding MarR family transcriptional regulator
LKQIDLNARSNDESEPFMRATPITNITNKLLLAFVALVIAGCSAAKLAYNNATTLASFYISGYVSLEPEQKELVDQRLDKFFAWHRKQELPEIRKVMVDLETRMDGALTGNDINQVYLATRERYRLTAEKALPDIAEVLSGLSEEQVQQIERKLAKDNAKRAKDAAKPAAERLRKRGERLIDETKDWCGSLTKEQRELLLNYNSKLPSTDDLYAADLKFRQQEFLKLIRTHRVASGTDKAGAAASIDSIVKGMQRLMFQQTEWRNPEYTAKNKVREEMTGDMMSKFAQTMSAEQKAHFKKRLRGYAEDVTTLMAG